MTEREKFQINEMKMKILHRDGYRCQYPGCDKPAIFLAHRIAQTKGNIKKYGKSVIHSERNLISVCEEQAHNDYFNVGDNIELINEIINKIDV